MKIEIEISEQDIRSYLEDYMQKNLRSRFIHYDFKSFIDAKVKEALSRSLAETDYVQIIEKNCRDVVLEEIEKAAKKKLQGGYANK